MAASIIGRGRLAEILDRRGASGSRTLLSWARHIEQAHDRTCRATSYYLRSQPRSDAVHLQRNSSASPRCGSTCRSRSFVRKSGATSRAADVGNLDDKDIFMCGPRGSTTDLRRQFVRLGVAGDRIHFEDYRVPLGPLSTYARRG